MSPNSTFDASTVDSTLSILGFESFRTGQRDAIETLLKHHHLLLVAPTGGGKSLCYQLPAILLPGTTVVVSPLVSLMHDQVQALEKRGVSATYFASTVPAAEMRRRTARASNGDYKLVYVAPERLRLARFRQLLETLECPLIAVDEAHCISEWGHDFRPDYLALAELIRSLEAPRVLACTATATPIVRDEIVTRLQMPPGTPQLLHGFARPNLALRCQEVQTAKERCRAVDLLLQEALGHSDRHAGGAIVYAPTRKTTEAEATRLQDAGWRAGPYHAGLAASQRDRVQTAFIDRSLDVVVATNAFGMGIDRSDVRAVVHLAPPGSIEAYYQEVGRAGRDGAAAVAMLLVSARDLPLRRHLISMPDGGGVAPDPAIVEHKWNLFLELIRWSEGGSCRHDAILRYFGDEAETLDGCGRCDVCLTLGDGSEEIDEEETSLLVRKALSAVARVHRRLGLMAAVKLLRGDRDPRLERWRLDRTPTFGVLSSYSTDWLVRLMRRLVTAGWIDFSSGDRPMVVLTESGRKTMLGRQPARVLLPSLSLPGQRTAGQSRRPRTAVSVTHATPEEERIFESLRSFRSAQAGLRRVPAYVVASDRTLRDIAKQRPHDLEQLSACFGIGPAKIREYGEGLLAAMASSTRPAGLQ